MQLLLLLFVAAVTLCACQNPGRFQAPQIEAAHFWQNTRSGEL
jgi:hypothetical protein